MKNILLIIASVSWLFSSCKKEDMSGDYSIFVGEWKCEYRYIHQNYTIESVAGTSYEHTLYIDESGRYRIAIPGGRDNKGRIREIRHEGGGSYTFEFVKNFFTAQRILDTKWYEIFIIGDYLTIYTDGEADFHYVKIN